MIFEGLKLMAIRLAVQYGDGQALAAFWKDGMINYTRGKKVHRRKKVVPKQIDLSKQLKLSATFGDGISFSGSTELRLISSQLLWGDALAKLLHW